MHGFFSYGRNFLGKKIDRGRRSILGHQRFCLTVMFDLGIAKVGNLSQLIFQMFILKKKYL
jgi:hypothetical protein